MWYAAKIINRIEPHYTTQSERYKWWENPLKAKVEASGMKQELLDLINQIDDMRKPAHSTCDYIQLDFVIYDVDEFVKWKQKIKCELIAIPHSDSYIASTLELVNIRYDGLNDKRYFMELTGALEAIRDNIDRYYTEGNSIDEPSGKKVFIVHGHDETVRDKVELFLHRIGLQPVILCNQPDEGHTIIEKNQKNTDVSFAIVLYTGCDVGKLKTDTELRPRARQNVVFEHGYLINKLGRKRVVALVEDDVETPSDMSGVLYISLSDTEWKQRVLREMEICGLRFDATRA